MIIKIKQAGKFIDVDVSREECRNYKCFSPHRFTHQNETIDKNTNTWQDKNYSCSHRNYHGCPDNPTNATK